MMSQCKGKDMSINYNNCYGKYPLGGKGKIVYRNDDICTIDHYGEWYNGYLTGEGNTNVLVVDKDKVKDKVKEVKYLISYKGSWYEGKRNGFAKLVLPNSSSYEGGFRNGKFHGSGTFKCLSFNLEGQFDNGLITGRTIITLTSGQVFKKSWHESKGRLSLVQVIAYVRNEIEQDLMKELKKRREEQLIEGHVMTNLSLKRKLEEVKLKILDKRKELRKQHDDQIRFLKIQKRKSMTNLYKTS